MQKFHRGITLERFDKFVDKNLFNDVNLTSCLFKAKSDNVQLSYYQVPELQRIPFSDAVSNSFKPAKVGDSFGPSWSTVWFRISVTIPAEFANEDVVFLWDCGNEGLIWSFDGRPLQGLTGGDGRDRHVDYPLCTKAVPGTKYEFYLEMANNGMFGVANGTGNIINPPDPQRFFTLKTCQIAIVNTDAFAVLNDFTIISSIAKELPDDSQEGNDALVSANAIINAYDPTDLSSLKNCLQVAKAFFDRQGSSVPHSVTAVGHCHIDTAWLWTYDESKRKCARSWSTQIGLMKKYPEYKFACSQMQQFEWVEKNYPSLFEEIKEYVKKNQFIPIGGTWVEMDCNIPSGESFVRQFLYGQRYCIEKFGISPSVFWLPDTFGYAAQLPQIVKGSGMKYFLTQKLSWNNINKFPNNTFYWVGLDGSKVLTHFPPADSYTSQAQLAEINKSVKNNKDKFYSNESLLVFGNGDGGGGPLDAMLERLRRMKNLNGVPKVSMGHPNDFFARVEKNNGLNLSGGLIEWSGELYFELHRGTYTSQALTKWYNRKLEFLLRDVEFLSTFNLNFSHYPKKDLDNCWKNLLLNQFHDALPGSSIDLVYDDTTRFYEEIDKVGKDLREKAFNKKLNDVISKRQGAKDLDSVYVEAGAIELFEVCCSGLGSALMKNALNKFKKADLALSTLNTLSFARNEVIEVEVPEGLSAKDIPFAQVDHEGKKGLVVAELKPFCLQTQPLKKENLVPVEITSTEGNTVMENHYVKVAFNGRGQLVSYYDKVNQRDIVPTNSLGNVFKIYEDVPLYWDAWDVEVYHLEKCKTVSDGKVTVIEKGPVRASILIEVTISKTSKLRQIVSLTSISPRLDFATEVDWNENRRFLKVEFAANIQSDMATYETAYGWVRRPTHFNTSWDMAKFEVCGHKFADLSEYGYGVALLNDSKYGYAIHGNLMRLSLLRAPKSPDPNCDIGHHKFKYALFPHKGTFAESSVVYEGLKFNVDILSRLVPKPDNKAIPTSAVLEGPFFQCSAPNVIIDCIKKSEDGNDVIVRMYEAYGGRCPSFKLSSTMMNVKSVSVVNLLETQEDSKGVNFTTTKDGFTCHLDITPFQVLTVRIQL